jgi:hypothetical protein
MTFLTEKLEITGFPVEKSEIAKFPLEKGVRGIFECQSSAFRLDFCTC